MPREHEFDQDDVFGICKNCGKYVEQLMEERYCTMERETKYPGADTSAARLNDIISSSLVRGVQTVLPQIPRVQFGPGINSAMLMLYDLLAMIEERDRQISADRRAYQNYIDETSRRRDEEINRAEGFRQQLHDQRWRQFSEEEPPFDQLLQVQYDNDIETAEHRIRRKPSKLNLQRDVAVIWEDAEGDYYYRNPKWWRPIPPLPTDKRG